MSTAQIVPLLVVAFVLGAIAAWWFLDRRSGATSSASATTSRAPDPSTAGRRALLEVADEKVAAENRELREKVSTLNGRLKKLDGRVARFDEELAAASSREQSASTRAMDLEERVKRMEEERDAARAELRQLRGELATGGDAEEVDVDALRAEVEEERRRAAAAADRVTRMQGDLDDAKRAQRDAERARDEARSLFDDANRERGAIRQELEQLRGGVSAAASPGAPQPPVEESVPTTEQARDEAAPDSTDDSEADPTDEAAAVPMATPETEATDEEALEDTADPAAEEPASDEAAPGTSDVDAPTEPASEPTIADEPASTEPAAARDHEEPATTPEPAVTEAAAVREEATPGRVPTPGEDDLTRIEGIGPKTAVVLHRAGIGSWRALAMASADAVDRALTDGGVRFAPHRESWKDQAELLAAGDEAGHDALVASLEAPDQD